MSFLFDSQLKKKIIGIAVTSMSGNKSMIDGIEVRNIDTFLSDFDATVVIAIKDERIVRTIRKELVHKNFKKVLAADYEKLEFYRILEKIQRSKMYLKRVCPFRLPKQEELWKKELNIGKFFDCEKLKEEQGLKCNTLSMVWGGSSILDYALLRGLVIKY